MSSLLRVWRRAPAPAVLAVLSLGIGWAIATVVASGWSAFRFGPLPYRHGEEIYALLAHDRQGANNFNATRTENVLTIGRSLPAKFHLVLQTDEGAVLQAPGVDRYINPEVVSAEYFELFGVTAARGRMFGSADSLAGDLREIVLSDHLWHAAFSARNDVIGSRVYLDSLSYEVVGVAPRQLDEGHDADAWIPMDNGWVATKNRNHLSLGFVTGVTRETHAEAEAAVQRGIAQLRREQPEKTKNMRVEFVPLRQFMFQRSFATSILLPFASVIAAGILLVGCLNFTVLVLLRGVARSREFAIRSALGASPWRIMRRVLAEGQLLVALALGAGVLIATWVVQGARIFEAPIFPGWLDPHLDWRVATVMALAAAASGALFALPAARVLRGFDVQQSLRIGDAGASRNRRALRLLDTLVFGELLLAAVFLPIGTMFGVVTLRENRLNVGFDYHDLVRVELEGRRAGGPGSRRLPLPHDLADAARAVPGVLSVTDGGIARTNGDRPAFRTDHDQAAHADVPRIAYSSASLLRTFRIPVVQGRLPTATEEANDAPVAILSTTAALRLFPNENPLGRSIVFDDGYLGRQSLTVVGTVADVRTDVLERRDSWATVFTLIAQQDSMRSTLYVRVPGFSASRADALTAQLERVVPGAEVMRLVTVESSLKSGLTQLRVISASLAAITGVFVILAVAGVFGTAAYSVRLRLREVGIRRALGATDFGIVRLLAGSIGRRAMLAALLGLPMGIMGIALIASGGDTVSEEPGVVATIVIAMLLVVLAGALGPIVRGLRVSPTDVLREE